MATGDIKFDVTGIELRAHCVTKEKYHAERSKFYAAQVKVFEKEVTDIARKLENTYSNTTSVSNQDRMEASKSHHDDRVRFFRFATTHLKQKTYKMSKSELAGFEMIPS